MRNQFDSQRWYVGNLVKVEKRPIENRPTAGNYMVIRLDFEIYIVYEHDKRIHSRGELACRDIIIGADIDPRKDSGLSVYAGALEVEDVSSFSSWEDRVGKVWIRLKFGGQREPETGRNPFELLERFDVAPYLIKRCRVPLAKPWVGIRTAAQFMGVSESTIRRKVDDADKSGIQGLIERTPGGHRKINLVLLRNIWEDQAAEWTRANRRS